MKSYIYMMVGVTMLLLTSCGQQYRAEETVDAFIEANAEDPDGMQKRDYFDLGSTRHISDSLVVLMRQRGASHFNKGINYPKAPQGDLYYLRMKYIYNGDTLQNTFYLNKELTEVVAFK